MGWMRNVFRRPPAPRGALDTSWAPGDLAECVYPGPWFSLCAVNAPDPSLGEIRVVDRVSLVHPSDKGPAMIMLHFRRYAPFRYHSDGFRKIIPRADRAEQGTCASLDDLLPGPHTPVREREDA